MNSKIKQDLNPTVIFDSVTEYQKLLMKNKIKCTALQWWQCKNCGEMNRDYHSRCSFCGALVHVVGK